MSEDPHRFNEPESLVPGHEKLRTIRRAKGEPVKAVRPWDQEKIKTPNQRSVAKSLSPKLPEASPFWKIKSKQLGEDF